MEPTTTTTSRVMSVQPAPPPLAARHFVTRLMFQTDPADLAADLTALHGLDLSADGGRDHDDAVPTALGRPDQASDACGCDVPVVTARDRVTQRLVVVDARTPGAFVESHIPGAVNLPHATIDERTTTHLDPDAIYVTYCWGPACNASTKAAANLAALGFQVKELLGGLEAWQAEGYAVEAGEPDRVRPRIEAGTTPSP